MQLIVSPADEIPIFRQIVRQILEAIAGNRLKPGDKLPSHRELSEQLVVAPLTVKHAYDELEALGYLETQRGRGTFVTVKAPEEDRESRLTQLGEDARKLLSQAYLAGLRMADVIDLLIAADREIADGRATAQEGRPA